MQIYKLLISILKSMSLKNGYLKFTPKEISLANIFMLSSEFKIILKFVVYTHWVKNSD